MKCSHRQRLQETIRPFNGSVRQPENRAAHGNIRVDQRCPRCGARRALNVNGRHVERGAWTLDTSEWQKGA